MAAIPARAANTEQALLGKTWSRAAMDAAIAALPSDFEPLTDARATQAYRLIGAASMLKRFYLQHVPDPPQLRVVDFA
jgi:xanthine dehydrogenase small subunit